MTTTSTKNFWNNNSDFQHLVEKLNKFLPDQGSVKNPRKNKKLEKFRKASNCYYDLYNNGLYNRASEFRSVFGIASTSYKLYTRHRSYTETLYKLTEIRMEEIVIEAAKEQGIF